MKMTKTSSWKKYFLIFLALYGFSTIAIWKRYNLNPTSMVNFGKEFALQNQNEVPRGAVVQLGEEGDLGGGYDGQIFYFFSRPISQFHLDWPKGFDESYRAPRIGYPFLIALFGFFGQKAAIFGMYFWNLALLFLSFLALRSMMGPEYRLWSLFYLVSPFALGSYSVLVSDSVMVSLVVLAYYFYRRKRYFTFTLLAGLAVVTKEPALFFLFPLGLKALWERAPVRVVAILSSLVIMIVWQTYLKFTFPEWTPGRLTDFIQPLEGITRYLQDVGAGMAAAGSGEGFRPLARLLGRFPLVILFSLGVALLGFGNFKKAWEFRLAMALVLFMIGSADHYYFWSVYENISRMFTISIPILVLWKKEDPSLPAMPYVGVTVLVLALFLVKLTLVSQTLPHELW